MQVNSAYIIVIFFCITLCFWWLGFAPDGVNMFSGKYGNVDVSAKDPSWMNKFLTDWGLFTAVGITAITIGSLIGGLNLLALVPFAIAYVLFDLFTFPVSIFTEYGFLPNELGYPLRLFFTLLKVLAFYAIIRSGN